MKKIVFCLISVAMTGYTSCNKEGKETSQTLFFGLPGTSIADMAIDNNNMFYFVTEETDKEAEWDPLSSNIPFRYYLSRKADETGNFEVLDDRYPGGKLCFDKNNHLWIYNYKAIYKFDGKSYNKILELCDNDYNKYIEFIAVDNDNNIWAGGVQTGLYKIDDHLNVTHYHVNNSKLPTNNVNVIHIDKNNDIWIVLYNQILKISNDQWVVYDNITSQAIWCLVTDKNGHLWIGTGWDNENQSLMRFDGTQWETVNPRNDKNELVKGTVRHLQSDGHKIYVVSVQVKDMTFNSNELLTFDGVKWDKIYKIPEDNGINDLIVDDYRQAVWVRTLNKGIFKIPF